MENYKETETRFPEFVANKLRILVCPPNSGGCAFYRCTNPMEKLQELFPEEVEIRYNLNPLGIIGDKEKLQKLQKIQLEENKEIGYKLPIDPWEKDWKHEDMKWADVIMVGNISNFGGEYTARIVGKAHEFGKFVHYDTDDLLTDLYDDHRLYATYKEKNLAEIVKFIYSKSHLVTVTQQKFAERIKPHCSAMIGVIGNAIDYDLPCWRRDRNDFKSRAVRIGWAGGIHHNPDVKVFSGVPHLVNQKVGAERVQWDFYGHPPGDPADPNWVWQKETWDSYRRVILKGFKGKKNWNIHYALPPNMYGVMYANMDIAIAPLKMNPFNDSKSDIKVAECSIYKVPLVASNVGCYSNSIINGETGYLLDPDASMAEWVRVLSSLVKNPSKIKKMGQNLYDSTRDSFDLNKVVGDRLTMYRETFKAIGYDPRDNRKFENETTS